MHFHFEILFFITTLVTTFFHNCSLFLFPPHCVWRQSQNIWCHTCASMTRWICWVQKNGFSKAHNQNCTQTHKAAEMSRRFGRCVSDVCCGRCLCSSGSHFLIHSTRTHAAFMCSRENPEFRSLWAITRIQEKGEQFLILRIQLERQRGRPSVRNHTSISTHSLLPLAVGNRVAQRKVQGHRNAPCSV